MLKRDKMSIIYGITFPMVFMIIGLVISGSLKKLDTETLTAVDMNLVTSSTFTDSANVF